MNIRTILLYILSVIFLPIVKGAIPGSFFWRPRVGIEIINPNPITEELTSGELPSSGKYVLIDGYRLGISVVALSKGFEMAAHDHQNPLKAAYHNNVYRWTLRYIKRLGEWLELGNEHYTRTHRVWKNRYTQMDSFIPKWLRPIFFYVKGSDWKKDEEQHRRFQKYAEHVFSPHYVFQFDSKMKSAGIKTLVSSFSFPIPKR